MHVLIGLVALLLLVRPGGTELLWDTTSKPNVTHFGGLSKSAVPSLIIGGAAKAGTTDLWSVMAYLDPHCQSKFRKDTNADWETAELDKEVNVPFISGEFVNNPQTYPCPLDETRNFLRCPRSERKNHDFQTRNVPQRNMTKCKHWLEKVTTNPASFTLDANPYIMREATERMGTFLKLNSQKYLQPMSDKGHCLYEARTMTEEEKRLHRPLMMVIIRHPVERSISYFNWFIIRTKTVPIQTLVNLELEIMREKGAAAYFQVLREDRVMGTPGKSPREVARGIVDAYEALKAYMKVRLREEMTKQHPGMNFEKVGLLVDSLYLPQILGMLYPKESDDTWPMLVVQSEFFFKNREEVFDDVLVPYLHSDRVSELKAIPKYSESMKAKASHSQKWSNMNRNKKHLLDDDTLQEVNKFYCPYLVNLYNNLHDFQASKVLAAVPTVTPSQHLWWKLCE